MDYWSHVIAAEELNHPTKIGIVDVPVVLDCPWLKRMIKVLPFWARGPPPQRLQRQISQEIRRVGRLASPR